MTSKRMITDFSSVSYLRLNSSKRLNGKSDLTMNGNSNGHSLTDDVTLSDFYSRLHRALNKFSNGNSYTISPTIHYANQVVFQSLFNIDDVVIVDQFFYKNKELASKIRSQVSKILLCKNNDFEMLDRLCGKLRRNKKLKRIWYCVESNFNRINHQDFNSKLYSLINKHNKLHVYLNKTDDYNIDGNHFLENSKKVIFSRHLNFLAVPLTYTIFPDSGFYENVQKLNSENKLPSKLFSGLTISDMLSTIDFLETNKDGRIEVELARKIRQVNGQLMQAGLPVTSYNESPVFSIATPTIKSAILLNKTLFEKGFYLDAPYLSGFGMFEPCLSFQIKKTHSEENVKRFIDILSECYVKVMKKLEIKRKFTVRHFRKLKYDISERSLINWIVEDPGLNIVWYDSIEDIGKESWNSWFPGLITMNYDWIKLAEEKLPDRLIYYTIEYRDKVVLSTVLTIADVKSEFHLDKELSINAEVLRGEELFALRDKVIYSGTRVSSGQQVWIDRGFKDWKMAVKKMLDDLKGLALEENCSAVYLSYFSEADESLFDTFQRHSFLKYDASKAYVLNNLADYGTELWLKRLRSKARYDWLRRYGATNVASRFNYIVVSSEEYCGPERIKNWYQLYLNVQQKGLVVSTDPVGLPFFVGMLRLKDGIFIEVTDNHTNEVVGFIYGKSEGDSFAAILIGMDYNYQKDRIYNYLLMAIIREGQKLGFQGISMGITADTEKRILRCDPKESFIFAYKWDTFNEDTIRFSSV